MFKSHRAQCEHLNPDTDKAQVWMQIPQTAASCWPDTDELFVGPFKTVQTSRLRCTMLGSPLPSHHTRLYSQLTKVQGLSQ